VGGSSAEGGHVRLLNALVDWGWLDEARLAAVSSEVRMPSPLPSEYGTYKTVRARFASADWGWLDAARLAVVPNEVRRYRELREQRTTFQGLSRKKWLKTRPESSLMCAEFTRR